MHNLTLRYFYFTNLFFFSLINSQGFDICINQSSFVSIAKDNVVVDAEPGMAHEVWHFNLTSKSKIQIPTTFYDRDSDVLLVAAPALPAPKEAMKAFAKTFPYYDVITFDYRWSGQYEQYLATSILARNPIQRVLFDPIKELETVVHYATKRKHYKKVVGLGECYSCFHFAKLQSDAIEKYGFGPFTHLVLDSCWYSLRDFAERICYDPLLPINPQNGGAPKVIRWLTDSSPFKYIILGLAFCFMSNVSIKHYISSVGIPILFVHGKNDLFVPGKHFDKIWNSANKNNRAVFLTPFKHSDNLGAKKLYRYVAEQFVASQSMYEFQEKVLK